MILWMKKYWTTIRSQNFPWYLEEKVVPSARGSYIQMLSLGYSKDDQWHIRYLANDMSMLNILSIKEIGEMNGTHEMDKDAQYGKNCGTG